MFLAVRRHTLNTLGHDFSCSGSEEADTPLSCPFQSGESTYKFDQSGLGQPVLSQGISMGIDITLTSPRRRQV